MADALVRTRSALIAVAQLGGTVTYTQLEAATGRAYSRRNFGSALDVLSIDCQLRNEPSLAALVVHKTGDREVGSGFVGDAVAERDLLYQWWGS